MAEARVLLGTCEMLEGEVVHDLPVGALLRRPELLQVHGLCTFAPAAPAAPSAPLCAPRAPEPHRRLIPPALPLCRACSLCCGPPRWRS